MTNYGLNFLAFSFIACILNNTKAFNVYHFNDSYKLQNANFFYQKYQEVRKELKDSEDTDTQITFSGDLISPSLVSTEEFGLQFKTFLNRMGKITAVVGNHEVDFGIAHFENKIRTLGPVDWLSTNLLDKKTNKYIGGCQPTKEVILEDKTKICYMGLIDQNWVGSSRLTPDDYILLDFKNEAKIVSNDLKLKGCHIIIALTHMNNESDMEIINDKTNDIDFVLGGHVHEYSVQTDEEGKRFVLKSGVDFQNFTVLKCNFQQCDAKNNPKKIKQVFKSKDETNLGYEFCIEVLKGTEKHQMLITLTKVNVDIHSEENLALSNYVDNLTNHLSKNSPLTEYMKTLGKDFTLSEFMGKEFKDEKAYKEVQDKISEQIQAMGISDKEFYLDSFDHIMKVEKKLKTMPAFRLTESLNLQSENMRTSENELGNLMTDVLRAKYDKELGFINSGTFRSEKIYDAGTIFYMLDLKEIFPFPSVMYQGETTVDQYLKILNNGCFLGDSEAGGYFQNSGSSVFYNSSPEANQNRDHYRINNDLTIIKGKFINEIPGDRKFSIVTTQFLQTGKDGYEALKALKMIPVNDELTQYDIMREFALSVRTKEDCDVLEAFKKNSALVKLDDLIEISLNSQDWRVKNKVEALEPTKDELTQFAKTFDPLTKYRDHELLGQKLTLSLLWMISYLDKPTLLKLKYYLLMSGCQETGPNGNKTWIPVWAPTKLNRQIDSKGQEMIRKFEQDLEGKELLELQILKALVQATGFQNEKTEALSHFIMKISKEQDRIQNLTHKKEII